MTPSFADAGGRVASRFRVLSHPLVSITMLLEPASAGADGTHPNNHRHRQQVNLMPTALGPHTPSLIPFLTHALSLSPFHADASSLSLLLRCCSAAPACPPTCTPLFAPVFPCSPAYPRYHARLRPCHRPALLASPTGVSVRSAASLAGATLCLAPCRIRRSRPGHHRTGQEPDPPGSMLFLLECAVQ
jgi:hypothetical protein